VMGLRAVHVCGWGAVVCGWVVCEWVVCGWVVVCGCGGAVSCDHR
jgi:hypothetical protein